MTGAHPCSLLSGNVFQAAAVLWKHKDSHQSDTYVCWHGYLATLKSPNSSRNFLLLIGTEVSFPTGLYPTLRISNLRVGLRFTFSDENKYTVYPVLFTQYWWVWSNREEWGGRGMYYVWWRVEVYTVFRWGNLRKREHMEDSGIDGKDNIKMDLQEVGIGVWTGSMWLRIGTSGGHLWMR